MRSLAFSLRVSYIVAAASVPVLLFVDLSHFGVREWLFAAIASTMSAVAYVSVTHGIRKLDVGESATLLLLVPPLTAMLAFIVLDETLGRLDVAGIATGLVGAYVSQMHADGIRGMLRRISEEAGLQHVARGILLYAVVALIDRMMLTKFGIEPITYLAVAQILIAVAMTAYALALRKRHHVRAALAFPKSCHDATDAGVCETERLTSNREWLGTVYVVLATIANRFFFLQAAAIAPIGPVSAVRRTSTLFTVAFDERGPRRRRIIAASIMFAGITLLAIG